jgi:hypothetical protein
MTFYITQWGTKETLRGNRKVIYEEVIMNKENSYSSCDEYGISGRSIPYTMDEFDTWILLSDEAANLWQGEMRESEQIKGRIEGKIIFKKERSHDEGQLSSIS